MYVWVVFHAVRVNRKCSVLGSLPLDGAPALCRDAGREQSLLKLSCATTWLAEVWDGSSRVNQTSNGSTGLTFKTVHICLISHHITSEILLLLWFFEDKIYHGWIFFFFFFMFLVLRFETEFETIPGNTTLIEFYGNINPDSRILTQRPSYTHTSPGQWIHGALRPQKALRHIRDAEIGGQEFLYLHLLTTLSPSEWFYIKVGSCVRHFNVSLIVWAKSQDSVHKPQFFKRKESRSGSKQGPSAYQPSALTLGHTGSLVNEW